MPDSRYEWIVGAQASKVEGFRHQHFASACKDVTPGKHPGPDGIYTPHAGIRIVTPWHPTKADALRDIESRVSRYESGCP